MNRILLALFASVLFLGQAHADFTGKNATGATITFKNPGDCTAVVCVPEFQLVDAAGTSVAMSTAALQTTQNTNITAINTVLGTQGDSVCGTATGACSQIALLKFLNNAVNSPPPLNVNAVNTAWTGLVPGVAQTGTIVAANMDLTSKGGVGYGAMANYGTSPGAVKVDGVNAFVTNTVAVSLAANQSVNNAQIAGTTTDTNSGNKSAGTQRMVLATDQPNLTTPLNVKNSFGTAQLSSAAFDINSSGDNIVVTRAVGTIKVYGIDFACATNQTTVSMKNGAGTTVGGPYYNVGTYAKVINPEPSWITTSTNNFIINLSGATHCGGTVYYLDN